MAADPDVLLPLIITIIECYTHCVGLSNFPHPTRLPLAGTLTTYPLTGETPQFSPALLTLN